MVGIDEVLAQYSNPKTKYLVVIKARYTCYKL